MKIYFIGDQNVENIERPEISIRTNGQVFHISETERGILVTGYPINIKIMPTSSSSVILQTGKQGGES